jgi:hypothetical protein
MAYTPLTLPRVQKKYLSSSDLILSPPELARRLLRAWK